MKGAAFEPLRVGPMHLRNRIVRTAHGVRLPWSDDGGGQIGYHLARARGGCAMAIIGIGGVHRTNPTVLPTHEDRVIPGLRAITDAVHEHGMKLVVQIWHGGNVKPNALGGSSWSASAVPNYMTGDVPIPMTKAMIDEMVESFAKAAGRIKAGGADGVEIHGANGYLITQFMSRASNFREDDYGGSQENRLRFVNEVLDAVRSEIGADLALGLRLSSHEFVENGLTPPETAEIAQSLQSKIDYLNVSTGGYFRPDFIAAPMDMPMAYQLDYSSVVTRAVSVPTIVTGRIMTMDVANHIVESGASDMVSMVRGLIADPEIVVKSADDRTEQIRPCIGTLICVGSTMSNSFACAVNPSAGHELERPVLGGPDTMAAVRRRVLVAGGGPAGMEAARSAALRGHEVTLVELRKQLGGQVLMAARAPYRSDIAAIVHWQADELSRVGVKVLVNHAVDPDVVAELDPDVLVLATGSAPREDGIQLSRPATPLPGIRLPHVYSSWDLFGHGRTPVPGNRALVYDDTGEYEPLAVADELVAKGVAVTYVTGFDSFGERIGAKHNTITPTLRRLVEGGVQLVTRSSLLEIGKDEMRVRVGDAERVFQADSVFFVGINAPNRDLLDYLPDFRGEVHTVGDAAGFHTLTRAIHDGDGAGRAI
ncbi:oxidoreductase [Amycolatopsis alkalitolerans]|uniref:FAD-dependent oxidoreductase n=1 Tax=Amycolatopsis alkalitolerans TaxID=2547244 RepID=A0A5C4LTC4_9PSEU|nr:FAD-dependent oxidoreductase [Amycolatopsis alkalitolerans]TNC20590.1 FAD-dependent oxidoreductase [Amycolatopsis alkalitolerans]